jgi:hypothetical protein
MADQDLQFENIYESMNEKDVKQRRKLLNEPSVETFYCYSILNCLFTCCFLYE